MSAVALVLVGGHEIGPLAPVVEQAREYARRSKSAATRRGYAADWKSFTRWCDEKGLLALPATPETVALYISDCANRLKASSIQRHVSAISQGHCALGHESPCRNPIVRSVMAGIRRTLGTAPTQKAPLLTADLKAMVDALPNSTIGIRDRALLLLGFACASRRSELVSLDVGDLSFSDDGIAVLLRRSKTDQEGVGRKIGVPRLPASEYCPVCATQAWLDTSSITTGPLFRPVALGGRIGERRLSDRTVAILIKKRLPDGKDRAAYSGHSLRAGFVTAACCGGASIKAICNQTGHRSISTVMRYIREASLFKGNALPSTGL